MGKITVAELIEITAQKTAERTLEMLKRSDRIKWYKSNSFNRTKELLLIYPYLPESEERQRIRTALDAVQDEEYFDIIESYFFKRESIAKIAERYDLADRTVTKKRNQLVKKIALRVFPVEMAKEILEKE